MNNQTTPIEATDVEKPNGEPIRSSTSLDRVWNIRLLVFFRFPENRIDVFTKRVSSPCPPMLGMEFLSVFGSAKTPDGFDGPITRLMIVDGTIWGLVKSWDCTDATDDDHPDSYTGFMRARGWNRLRDIPYWYSGEV